MQNYKIIVQYDGSKYNGWQKQGNTKNTIEEKIESVLSKMVNKDVDVFGSGRTDAGTHAKAQVANFKIETNKDNNEILNYLNEYLPEDIAVTSIQKVSQRFHSRLNAKGKKYLYTIQNSNISDVFERKFCYKYSTKLNINKMIEATQYLKGEHDFKGFCSNKKSKKSTVRTIFDIQISCEDDKIKLLFYGNGFLHNMVRIITGTLIEVGQGSKDINDIINILNSKNREDAGFTVPAHGLMLLEVIY